MANQIPQANINLNMSELKTIVCTCGKFIFDNVLMYKIMPAIYSPTGKSSLIALQLIRCVACGKVHNPEDVIKSINSPQLATVEGKGTGN